jgi:NAD(P)H-dependent FMN reductase
MSPPDTSFRLRTAAGGQNLGSRFSINRLEYVRVALLLSVLLGSSRIGRKSSGPALYLRRRLAGFPEVETIWLDLAEYRFPIMEQRMDEMDDLPPGLREFAAELSRSDGILIVAPEYKNGCPGVLKNALDYLPSQAFRHKALGICTVSAGGFGGINCLAQLRLICLALGGSPIPASLPVSRVESAFTPDGELLDEQLAGKAAGFLAELLWYTEAIANQRRGLTLAVS